MIILFVRKNIDQTSVWYYQTLFKYCSQRGKKSDRMAMEGSKAIDICQQIKKEMADFYKSEYSSTIDLQKSIKNRGFSFLDSNCEEGQTIVEIPQAQKVVDIYLDNLKDILPAKLYAHCAKFLVIWKNIKIHKFVKKEILFSEHGTSSACFVGVYLKRTNNELYICYKVCKNAFRLAPDIYVVQEVENESVMWGAFSSNSKVDRLEKVTRGFKLEDLSLLLEICSVSVIDLSIIKELE